MSKYLKNWIVTEQHKKYPRFNIPEEPKYRYRCNECGEAFQDSKERERCSECMSYDIEKIDERPNLKDFKEWLFQEYDLAYDKKIDHIAKLNSGSYGDYADYPSDFRKPFKLWFEYLDEEHGTDILSDWGNKNKIKVHIKI